MDNAADEPSLYSHHLPIDVRIGIARSAFRPKPDKAQPVVIEPATLTCPLQMPFVPGGDLPQFRDARETVVNQLEKAYLQQLAQQCGNDVARSCERSGLSRARLYELLKKHSVRLR
ncbi:hypothetical protein DSECCO2_399890 [anaerobic digester metagenome]